MSNLVGVLGVLVKGLEAPGHDEHVVNAQTKQQEGQHLNARRVELDPQDARDPQAGSNPERDGDDPEESQDEPGFVGELVGAQEGQLGVHDH